MPKRGKKYRESSSKIESTKRYDFTEAIDAAISSSYAKFDETIDVAVRLGVDPRHADQMVRGTVVLPNGLGKEVKVLVFAKGEKETEAKDAGAEFVGNEDLVEKIKEGWFGFDKAIATPDMMGQHLPVGEGIVGGRVHRGEVVFCLGGGERRARQLPVGQIDPVLAGRLQHHVQVVRADLMSEATGARVDEDRDRARLEAMETGLFSDSKLIKEPWTEQLFVAAADGVDADGA